MLSISRAIVEHSCRIMFFRHDGSGLPTTKGGTLYLILAVSLIARTLRDIADPDGFSVAVSVIVTALYTIMALSMFRPASMAALLLTNLFGYVVVGTLYLAGIANGYINNAIVVWELAALIVVLNKVVRQAQSRHNPNSSKN